MALTERGVARLDFRAQGDLAERLDQQLWHQVSQELIVAVVLDDAGQFEYWFFAINGLCRTVEARRVDDVCPAHQVVELVESRVELTLGHVFDELGARGIAGLEKEATFSDARVENALVFLVQKCRLMMIEEPGERRRRVETIVQDGVCIATEQRSVRASLLGTVAARVVVEFQLGLECPGQAREQHSARQTVETVPMSCANQAHARLFNIRLSNLKKLLLTECFEREIQVDGVAGDAELVPQLSQNGLSWNLQPGIQQKHGRAAQRREAHP